MNASEQVRKPRVGGLYMKGNVRAKHHGRIHPDKNRPDVCVTHGRDQPPLAPP